LLEYIGKNNKSPHYMRLSMLSVFYGGKLLDLLMIFMSRACHHNRYKCKIIPNKFNYIFNRLLFLLMDDIVMTLSHATFLQHMQSLTVRRCKNEYVDEGDCEYILWDGVLLAADCAGDFRTSSLKFSKIIQCVPWLGELLYIK
jgi:hypothetical protein